MSPHSSLQLKDLRYALHIGVGTEERQTEQPVRVSIELRFLKLPRACQSEKLDETVCYDALSRSIERVARSRTYLLIETLGFDIYTALRRELPAETLLGVEIVKEKPPIAALTGGAVFSLTDWSS